MIRLINALVTISLVTFTVSFSWWSGKVAFGILIPRLLGHLAFWGTLWSF